MFEARRQARPGIHGSLHDGPPTPLAEAAMSIVRPILTGLLLLAAADSTSAQQWPARGTRVRLELDDRRTRLTGELIEDATDYLTLYTQYGTVMRTLLASVERIEVSHGKQRRPQRGAAIGAGLGLAAGVLVFYRDLHGDNPSVAAIGEMTLVGAVSGLLLANLFPAEQWSEVPRDWPLSPTLSAGPLGRLTIGVRGR